MPTVPVGGNNVDEVMQKLHKRAVQSNLPQRMRQRHHIRPGRAAFLQRQLAPRKRWQAYIRSVTGVLLRRRPF